MRLLRNTAAIAATCLALALALAVAGCKNELQQPAGPATDTPRQAGETPAPGDHTIKVSFGGKDRSFLVHAPTGYDGSAALPLVIAMHYYPGNGAGMAVTSDLSAKADQENFLVVYPDGYLLGFNALICCGAEDDLGFIKLIVQRMIDRWKADPKRVYATGISNGADMSYKLAVELPGTFAAIAPVSGLYGGTKAADPAYVPRTPVAVLTFVGAKDRYVDPIEAGLTKWQERLSCKASERKSRGRP